MKSPKAPVLPPVVKLPVADDKQLLLEQRKKAAQRAASSGAASTLLKDANVPSSKNFGG